MKLRTVLPSRILNQNSGAFGLSFSDFGGALAVFLIVTKGLEGTGTELVALPLALVALMALVPLRLSTRRHIVRDYFKAQLSRFLFGRAVYDPRDKRRE